MVIFMNQDVLKIELELLNNCPFCCRQVGCDAAVDLDTPVSKVEGQRLLIQTEEDFAGKYILRKL